MRLKLDENLGQQGAELLRLAGHNVNTVLEQGLSSAPDAELIEVCRTENRCLVTLDLDFSNPLRFPPSDYAGIAVLRLPPRPTPGDLIDAVQTLVGGLEREQIEGRLWIIQRGGIRVYQSESGGDS